MPTKKLQNPYINARKANAKKTLWKNFTRTYSGTDKTGMYTAQLGIKGAGVFMGMKLRF